MTSILKVDTIQDQAGNNIINESSDTITIGASGDVIAVPAGSAAAPVITTTGDTNTGMFFPAADTIGFAEGGAEAMRIDSSGQVGIGTTSPGQKLDIGSGTLRIKNSIGDSSGLMLFQDTGDLSVMNNFYAGAIAFQVNSTERMRIDSSGNVLVGKTSTSGSVAGINLVSNGVGEFIRNAERSLFINRLTNDGTLVQFAQATIDEGSISISGSTVSYNGFTGTHWSRFIDESKPDVLRGTVLESLDQMTDWYHAEFETSYTEKDKDGNDVVKTTTQKKPYALKANEQEGDVITYNFEGTDYQATIVKQKDVKHVMSKISDTVEAKNVYGVFHAWDNDDLINNDFYVASVGSYVVRIKAGQVVAKGDLLQSNGDGTAKVQADDMIRASTFAKVLSNTVIETYEDGSFIVPCSLMC
jgi:hypothetical protein